MATYRDTPMDYADASLIAAAQTLRDPRIFTLDRHFHAYRFADGVAPQVIP
jgi:predicted nucleic acid-binding protein